MARPKGPGNSRRPRGCQATAPLHGRASSRLVQAVVLAGGLATRMRPQTLTVPKSLLEVAGRPFIDWQLDRLVACGLRDIVMCVGHLGEKVRAHVEDGERFGARVRWSQEGSTLLGTAGA